MVPKHDARTVCFCHTFQRILWHIIIPQTFLDTIIAKESDLDLMMVPRSSKIFRRESNPFINDKGQKHMNPEKLKCTMTMFFQLVIIESATFSFPVKPKLVTQVSRQVTPSS